MQLHNQSKQRKTKTNNQPEKNDEDTSTQPEGKQRKQNNTTSQKTGTAQPHNQPVNRGSNPVHQLVNRGRGKQATSKHTKKQPRNSQVCASKEQTKEPHNQPADENTTSQLCASKKQTKGTMHTTSQQTKIQPRNYVPAKNRLDEGTTQLASRSSLATMHYVPTKNWWKCNLATVCQHITDEGTTQPVHAAKTGRQTLKGN